MTKTHVSFYVSSAQRPFPNLHYATDTLQFVSLSGLGLIPTFHSLATDKYPFVCLFQQKSVSECRREEEKNEINLSERRSSDQGSGSINLLPEEIDGSIFAWSALGSTQSCLVAPKLRYDLIMPRSTQASLRPKHAS